MEKAYTVIDYVKVNYDPENDAATPRVSYTEYRLMLAIEHLQHRIEELESFVEHLQAEKTLTESVAIYKIEE